MEAASPPSVQAPTSIGVASLPSVETLPSIGVASPQWVEAPPSIEASIARASIDKRAWIAVQPALKSAQREVGSGMQLSFVQMQMFDCSAMPVGD